MKNFWEMMNGSRMNRIITTTQYQGWRTVALMTGLGFNHERDEHGDVFISEFGRVEKVFDGWEPSKDGSRLSNWSELSDPESPHCGRRYLTAFHFTSPDRHEDVIVWQSSPHESGQLYAVVALGGYYEWSGYVNEDKNALLKRWLVDNAISI